MSERAALARMLVLTPPDRLAWRALYVAKRRLRVGLANLGFSAPISRPPRAEPLPFDRWPRRRVPQQHPGVSPGVVHLHGLDWEIGPRPHWTAALGFTGTDLQLVHLHEHRWCAALSDESFVEVLTSWIDQVRPYGPRYWIAAWNGYTLASRIVTWMREIPRRELPQPFVDKACESLIEQLSFLYRNLEYDIRGNHLLRDLLGLAWGAACFEGADAERWRARVLDLLPAELAHQIHPDGLHYEGSPSYHLQVFADLLQIWQALPASEIREELLSTLDRMAAAIVLTTHPDGRPSLLSDGGLHTSPPPSALLHAFTSLTGRNLPPPPQAAMLGGGSIAIFRDEDHHLLIDCGPVAPNDLPAHGHADVFSFEWSIGGRRILTDTGVFAYERGSERDYARSTRAHNTLTLNDADQAEIFGSFRLGRRPRVTTTSFVPRPHGLVLTGHHDGYAHLPGQPIHHRRFDLRELRLFVEDRVTGGQGQRAAARLLLHPDVEVRLTKGGASLRVPGFRVRLKTAASVTVHEVPWWPDLGVHQATHQLHLDYGQAPCRGAFTLTVEAG